MPSQYVHCVSVSTFIFTTPAFSSSSSRKRSGRNSQSYHQQQVPRWLNRVFKKTHSRDCKAASDTFVALYLHTYAFSIKYVRSIDQTNLEEYQRMIQNTIRVVVQTQQRLFFSFAVDCTCNSVASRLHCCLIQPPSASTTPEKQSKGRQIEQKSRHAT